MQMIYNVRRPFIEEFSFGGVWLSPERRRVRPAATTLAHRAAASLAPECGDRAAVIPSEARDLESRWEETRHGPDPSLSLGHDSQGLLFQNAVRRAESGHRRLP